MKIKPLVRNVIVTIPVILQVAWVLAVITRLIHETRPLRGRCKQRSNLFLTDLSLTPVTYQSKLLGIHCVAAYKQLELFGVYIAPAEFFYQWENSNEKYTKWPAPIT